MDATVFSASACETLQSSRYCDCRRRHCNMEGCGGGGRLRRGLCRGREEGFGMLRGETGDVECVGKGVI